MRCRRIRALRGCSRAAAHPAAMLQRYLRARGLRRADGCERLRCERCGWGAMSCGTARTACFACVLASSSPSLVNGMETTAGGSARPQAIDAASVRCDGSTRARTALPAGACSSRHSGQRAMYRSPRANEPADVRQLATSAISGEKCGLRQALSIQQTPRATYNHAPQRLASSRAVSRAMSSCSSRRV